MTITRRDNCAYCHVRTSIKKDFKRPVDMFNPDKNTITQELKAQIIEWRDQPIYCPAHAYIGAERLLIQAQA